MIPDNSTSSPLLNGRAYEILKWTAAILLPAIGALYFALSGIWGFPNGEQVVGTIAAINVFTGAIVGISTKQYYNSEPFDGVINVLNAGDPEKPTTYDMVLDRDPSTIAGDRELRFRVMGD